MNILQKLKGSQLTTSYGYMYITTDKQIYLAGEEVKGNSIYLLLAILYLNIIQSGLLSNGIDINVDGLEQFNIGGEHSTKSYGCQILALKEQLFKFEDQQVKIGQFEIPFTFSLPNIMPGSFTYNIHKQIWANIKYEIIAEIKGINSGESMKCTHELLVQEPLKCEPREIQFQDIHHPIAFFCVNKGVSTLKYQINKNVFLLNETVFVWIEVDNRMSELDLQKIRISLLDKLILRSTSNQTVVWDNETELNFVVVGGVPAQYQANGQRKLLAQLILQDKMSDLLKQTVHGMTIQNKYELKIQVFYSGMKCGNYRINYIPITLLLPFPSANNAPQEPPQDWNPEILQQQKLAQAQLNENLEKNPYDIISEQMNL